ncbi:patatin-like phospholipase family protein [Kiloniella spongiae]|uniref:patatin-like phospholipase family protein n=1 Tax=Kiloniella spongiae TaxID=1489064 RepID=UPI001950EA45|nr:patatin-like phospholipase family protein [Kiloniella spongiae]
MTVKVWETSDIKPTQYPEVHYPEVHYKDGLRSKISSKTTVGIAFSGGGTRAATATIGQLRALHKLGWIKQVDYIAAVSGGSWTAIPYTFLPKHSLIDDDEEDNKFLGAYLKPDQLNDEWLSKEAEPNGMMASTIPSNMIAPYYLFEALSLRGDETYSSTIGRIFLSKFDLDDRSKFFTWNTDSRDQIIERNEEEKLSENDFITVERDNRPYLIVGGTLFSRDDQLKDDIYHVEMTPLYSGIPSQARITVGLIKSSNKLKGEDAEYKIYGERGLSPKERFIIDNKKKSIPEKRPYQPDPEPELEIEPHHRYIGGGYIDSFAFDSKRPRKSDPSDPSDPYVNVDISKSRYKFTLSDMAGISGAAPQETLAGLGLLDLGFPELRHWPISSSLSDLKYTDSDGDKDPTKAYEYTFGDGGHLDNLGIMPLLARKVDKIMVFINTPQPFNPYECLNIEDKSEFDNLCPTNNFLKDRLNTPRTKEIYGEVLVDDLIAMFRPIEAKPFNVVFENGEEELENIYKAFNADRAKGAPLTYCKVYKVKSNAVYNIKHDEEYKPTICWNYLDRAQSWIEEVRKSGFTSTQYRDLVNGKRDFKNFPHYGTFLERRLQLIALNPAQTNALSALTTWSILKSRDEIQEALKF